VKVPRETPSAPVAPAQELLGSLLQGYRPTFRRHRLGWEADALLELGPRQQMCYYDGKLFGGYLALLLDQILADCCRPAVTAYLHTSFARSVPPDVPIRLRAWPERVDGRKIYLVGSVQIPGPTTSEPVEAIRAHALFVRPRG
jgi:acyl-coenzyme A thioesterase PaaI-like protein